MRMNEIKKILCEKRLPVPTFLLDEIESRDAELERLKEENKRLFNVIEELLGGLSIYADEDLFCQGNHDTDPTIEARHLIELYSRVTEQGGKGE
ncbi:hypothetical protein [Paenibacillus pinihumi]|uniref:hypothetical protein n=1 Tax=Paenibacillus pinihumi TaxID=669462 RepID=UPI0004240113|nr:hypothetical protein [Paenibacillus pinihumi]